MKFYCKNNKYIEKGTMKEIYMNGEIDNTTYETFIYIYLFILGHVDREYKRLISDKTSAFLTW